MPDLPGPTVAVFGSSQSRPRDPDYEAGVRCGRLLAEAGFSVATGGYAGLMEAVSRGAAGAGGVVIGVTAPTLFPDRPGANEWTRIERPQPTLTTRLSELLDQSVAAIALPGSIGTLTELMVAWNASFIDAINQRPPRPVVAVGAGWADLVSHIAREVDSTVDLVTRVGDVDAAVAAVIAARDHF